MKYVLYLSLLFFGLISCRKEATSWYSDWTLPLINDTLNLAHYTNDSTLSTENGNYILDLSRKVASIKPSEYVKIPDTIIEQKFAIAFPSLLIAPGTSFITNNEDHIFDLDQIQLKKARVKSGKINIKVFSPIATSTFFEIELPSVTKNNETIKRTLQVPAGSPQNMSSNSLDIDLSAYVIEMLGSNGISFNALASKLKIYSDPNGNQVNLTSLDSTVFQFSMEGIELDYAKGYFGNYKVSDSYSFVSEYLKNKVNGSIDLPEIQLDLSFTNGIKTSAKGNLKSLKNTNSFTANIVNLTQTNIGNPFTIQSATNSWDNLTPSVKVLNFDQNNSNLEQFIENLGETTDIEYELELNPWGNISGGSDEFFPHSSFDVNLDLKMPLQIGLNNLVLKDTFLINVQQDLEKTNLESGILHLKIENAFPLDAQIELYFLDDFDQEIASILNIEKIKSSVYGNLTSLGVISSKSELNVQFSDELLSKMGEIKKIFAKVKLNSPNAISNLSEPVAIPEKAFFKLKAQASFKLENRIGK